MKERPILFSAPMVRAVLDGRKTQTRRIMKPQPTTKPFWGCVGGKGFGFFDDLTPIKCPYGQRGDRLWVRETCRAEELESGLDGVLYLADDAFIEIENTQDAADKWIDLAHYGKRASPVSPVKTVPAIHMPRWASRLTLDVTAVRVERLQEISESDAMAEGIISGFFGGTCEPGFSVDGLDSYADSAVLMYRELWESINGAGSWKVNPWVWALEFKRVSQ